MGQQKPNSLCGLDNHFMPSKHDGADVLGFDVMELELQGLTGVVSSDEDDNEGGDPGLDDVAARGAIPV
jgi:hypothetical protein